MTLPTITFNDDATEDTFLGVIDRMHAWTVGVVFNDDDGREILEGEIASTVTGGFMVMTDAHGAEHATTIVKVADVERLVIL